MILYFQAGHKRIAINTDDKTYTKDYFYLGGYKNYIKLATVESLNNIETECMKDGYRYDLEHNSI